MKKRQSIPTTSQKDVNAHKLAAAMAYILLPIPLVAGVKKSKFVRFHVNQGVDLALFAACGTIVIFGLSFITVGVLLIPAFLVTLTFLWLIGLNNVLRGQMRRLPIIGSYDLLP